MAGASVVYAKEWGSPLHYGAPAAEASLRATLNDWQVDESWFAGARADCRFMHCLPVRRNVAVADAVLDGERSVVLAEAFGGTRQAAPTALQHQAQRFAAGHQHRIRLLAPGLQARRILLVDLAGEQPFPFTVGDFLQLRLGQQHVGAGGAKRQLRGVHAVHASDVQSVRAMMPNA